MTEWISVEKRLPNKSDRYAILYRFGDKPDLHKFVADWDGFEQRWANLLPKVTIVYWTDFPPLPEEGE